MPLPKPRPAGVALVTGASSGIGDALARELRSRGYGLIVVARREDRLQKLADELGETQVIAFDLAEADARARLFERVAELDLEVDTLVNNAGFATGGPYADSDPDEEVAQVRILVEAPVALTSAFLPSMVRRGCGAILNVASTAGLGSLPHSAGYSAAKHHSRAFSVAAPRASRPGHRGHRTMSRPRLHRPLGERRGPSDRGSHPQAAMDRRHPVRARGHRRTGCQPPHRPTRSGAPGRLRGPPTRPEHRGFMGALKVRDTVDFVLDAALPSD